VEAFAGTSRTLGFMIGAVGVGALAATVVLARRVSVQGLGKWIALSLTGAGIAFSLFAFSRSYPLSLALLAFFGFGLVFSVASCNTIIQTVADEDKRGRVISLHVMAFLGIAPIGSFVGGAVSEQVGVQWTVFGCGLALACAGIWFGLGRGPWRQAVREVYVRQGVIPDVHD
jgi:predicted MFS family arabinose efflux permease